MRYVGAKYNTIYTVSDRIFTSEAYDVIEVPKELNGIAANELMDNFRVRNGKIVAKNAKIAAKELKVAFVGNYAQECGIALYNAHLWPEIAKHIGGFRLFIERNKNYVGSIYSFGDRTLSNEDVVACWERGKSLQELVNAIKLYDPDIIYLGHEYGLYPAASHFLSMISQLSAYRIITTLHSVYSEHRDKTICEAALPELIVHIQGAKDALQAKGVSGKVYVVAHGCEPCIDSSKLWNIYRTEHTIISQGFLFPYKGWKISLETISILKRKYNDIFFTGLCSENSFSKIAHNVYYNELVSLVEKLGIQENVSLIRGYQTDSVIDSYLRTNKVVMLPYIAQPGHLVFGASGAARTAMTKGLPVVSSNIPHFSDLPTIKADTPAEFAMEIDRLFMNEYLINIQVKKQNDFISTYSWNNIGIKHIKLFEYH